MPGGHFGLIACSQPVGLEEFSASSMLYQEIALRPRIYLSNGSIAHLRDYSEYCHPPLHLNSTTNSTRSIILKKTCACFFSCCSRILLDDRSAHVKQDYTSVRLSGHSQRQFLATSWSPETPFSIQYAFLSSPQSQKPAASTLSPPSPQPLIHNLHPKAPSAFIASTLQPEPILHLHHNIVPLTKCQSHRHSRKLLHIPHSILGTRRTPRFIAFMNSPKPFSSSSSASPSHKS
jgi:hypothetical protein